MTKRELRKKQKQEKLVSKIKNMSKYEYRKMQNKLENVSFKLFAMSLLFLCTGLTFGIGGLVAATTTFMPWFVGLALASVALICANSMAIKVVDRKKNENNLIWSNLISMEEIEEQQKQQTQEIIDGIKKERVVKAEVGVNQPDKEELENDNLSI